MSYKELLGAKQHLARALAAGDQQEIACAKRTLEGFASKSLPEVDTAVHAVSSVRGACARVLALWRSPLGLHYNAKNSSIVIVRHPVASKN
jgi:hypothetical protein